MIGQDEGGVPPLIASAPVPNFRQVNEWLYRGGQPDAEGLRYLRSLNIRTVISLRWWKSVIATEKLAVPALGMNFISIPLNYWTYPSPEDIELFLSILDDEKQRPVYVHCKHGSDRTGILLAIYRMARQGWSADQAYCEMKACGFHLFKMYHFKWAVYRFARELPKKCKT